MTEQIVILLGAILGCLLTIFVFNAILNNRLKGKSSTDEPLLSAAIAKVVIFLTAAILLAEAVNSFQILENVLGSSTPPSDILQTEIMYFSLMLGVTLLVHVINIWLSSIMFGVLSGGKSIFHEIANESMTSTLLFSGILLALTLVSKSGISLLLDKFIPYPTMPTFH